MNRRRRLLSLGPVLLLCATPLLAQPAHEWQQRVRYEMDVRLLADRHRMEGRQRATYFNHSPDTLHRVFYHLYFNAFHPNSMMAERNRVLPDPDGRIVPRIFELGPDEIGYHRISQLTQDGRAVDHRIFDTVMEVDLAEPIPPGGESVFEMAFSSQVPLQTRRSGRDNREGIDYSMSQWYPKIAAYDERGWHADPYVGREFYAPYGTFDVRITLPAEYVIGATGVLQNPEDVGHGYDGGTSSSGRSGGSGSLNFSSGDSVTGSSATGDSPSDDSLTWHFVAEDVHDFAWAADPDYLHDVFEAGDGTTVHLLYQPDVAEGWQQLHEWVPQMLSFFASRYGPYPNPQFTVAQAGDGGMEYPMMTFITGRRPPASLFGVTAHELAHMWFYGMLGTNEARHAWLDEGFTDYATTEVTAHVLRGVEPSHTPALLQFLEARHVGLAEPMNTRSDWFETNYAYSMASYVGGHVLLDMLGYVISDSLRDRFLLEYGERYAFRHPDPGDVERVAEDVSGMRLDWYFDQFGDTTWDLDYAVDRLRSRRTERGWETSIALERRARAVTPLDVRLTLSDGTTRWVHVPLSIAQGHKPVPENWIVAEPWAWTSPRYTFELIAPERVVEVEIDPGLRTPDRNRLNNRASLPLNVAFLQPPAQSWSRYEVGWRPLGQYAHNWGFAGGLQLRGRYLFNRYRTQATLKLWPELLFSRGEEPEVDASDFGTRRLERRAAVDGIDFDVAFSNTFSTGPLVSWTLRSRKHLGILQNDAAVSLLLDPIDLLRPTERRARFGVRHQYRTTDRSIFNHVSGGFEPAAMLSAYAGVVASGPRYRLGLQGEAGGSVGRAAGARTANRIWADAAWVRPLGAFSGSVQLFLGFGDDDLTLQKRFRLGSVPFEDRWADAAYRNVGGAFSDPLEDLHWAAFGAPGPVAYIPSGASPETGAPGGARHMAAVSVRLRTPYAASTGILRPLQAELFAGAGQAWNDGWLAGLDSDDVLADAGIGLRYDVARLRGIGRWTQQSDLLSNLVLAARLPFWAGRPGLTDEPEPFAFRWLLGVETNVLPGL